MMHASTHIPGTMLVDDDSITNYLNSEFIHEMDITSHVAKCCNGEEAMNHLRTYQMPVQEKSVTLIFLDSNMPGIDGFEFLEQLEKLPLPEEIDMVLLTTSENLMDMQKTARFNIRGYLNKPLTAEKISSIVNSMAS